MPKECSRFLISCLLVCGAAVEGALSGLEHFMDEHAVLYATDPSNGTVKLIPGLRQKRSGFDPYTKEEKTAILDRHNKLRGKTKAADMLMMEWNADLEKEAQRWADLCVFEHPQQPRKIGPFSYIGQNLYVSTSEPKETGSPVQSWYDEVEYYTYSKDFKCKPNEMCGHYTQVVWAESHSVGCAITFCENLRGASFPEGFLMVCEYGPGGNMMGSYPYKQGKPCSTCPGEYKYCVKNMCSKQSGSSGGSSNSYQVQTSTLLARTGLIFAAIFAHNILQH